MITEEQVIRENIRLENSNLYSSAPGIIQSFDAVNQTVTVQLSIKKYNRKNKQYEDIAPIVDVPIVLPVCDSHVFTYPIKKGDEVIVNFADRAIDNWFEKGGTQEPIEDRIHSISDGFAVLGVNSKPRLISNYSTNSTDIRNRSRTQFISLEESGKIDLYTDNANIDAFSGNNIEFNASTDMLYFAGSNWELTTGQEIKNKSSSHTTHESEGTITLQAVADQIHTTQANHTTDALGNITIVATNDVGVTSRTKDISLKGEGKVSLEAVSGALDASSGDTLSLDSPGAMSFTTGNDLSVNATNDMKGIIGRDIDEFAARNIKRISQGNMEIRSLAEFWIHSNDELKIEGNRNFIITGNDQIAITSINKSTSCYAEEDFQAVATRDINLAAIQRIDTASAGDTFIQSFDNLITDVANTLDLNCDNELNIWSKFNSIDLTSQLTSNYRGYQDINITADNFMRMRAYNSAMEMHVNNANGEITCWVGGIKVAAFVTSGLVVDGNLACDESITSTSTSNIAIFVPYGDVTIQNVRMGTHWHDAPGSGGPTGPPRNF